LAVNETRSDVIKVRLQPTERARFAAECKVHNITESEGLRRLVRAASGLGPTFDGEAKAAIEELSAQTRAVGVNFNQIARAMNQGLVPADATLRKVLEDIAETIDGYDRLFVAMVARARTFATVSLKDEQV
jgi:uncharacterized protein (DUF885 family)